MNSVIKLIKRTQKPLDYAIGLTYEIYLDETLRRQGVGWLLSVNTYKHLMKQLRATTFHQLMRFPSK